MAAKLLEPFVQNFRAEKFWQLQKAKHLSIFSLIMLFLFPGLLLVVVFVLQNGLFSLQGLIVSSLWASSALTLGLLRLGRYNWAANIFTLFTFAALAALGLFGEMKADFGVFASKMHFAALIVFSILFNDKKITILLTLAILIFAFVSNPVNNPNEDRESMAFLVNFGFLILTSGALGYLLQSISESSMRKLEEEADNREQLEQTRRLLHTVGDISEQLDQTAQTVGHAAGEFTQNAQNQASSSEEVTATVEQISSAMENIANHSEEQNAGIGSLHDRIQELAHTMKELLQEIDSAMNKVDEIHQKSRDGDSTLQQMNERMQKIRESSQEMTNIINIIRDISERIDLLALNASIEAARAGDSGRGFAVVADEIAKLADQTSHSVKDIGKLIQTSEGDIQYGLESAEGTGELIRIIRGDMESLGGMRQKIADYMKQERRFQESVDQDARAVRQKAEEIRQATGEQKHATNEITRDVGDISELTQKNAASSEELSSIVENMNQASSELKELVRDFRLDQK
jgi:methyl-accepting chemotaxis protein